MQGDSFELATQSGEVLGAAVLTNQKARNPVFVSIGSGLSLKSAVHLVKRFSIHRYLYVQCTLYSVHQNR